MTSAALEPPPRAPHEVALVDLVDRLLGKGVVAAGDVTLSVADVDLVYLDLRALIASAGTLASGEVVPATVPPSSLPASGRAHRGGGGRPESPQVLPSRERAPKTPRTRPRAALPGSRIDADPEHLEKGLAQLVLTLVELLRELMERQALRRIDAGTLSDEQIERLGETFMLLQQRMGELQEVFGLTDEDLNLDLGPLGNLL
jgi:gas vesicle protein GvpK/gas vesicle protein GvpA/GvpJ/GvpM family